MALPEITVEDLENISDNATDNRQRLQKSLRSGQLNIVKALGSIQNTLQLMYDNAKAQTDAMKAQRGFQLEKTREESRQPDDGAGELKAPKEKGGGIFGSIGKILKKYANLIKLAAVAIGVALYAFVKSEAFQTIKKIIIDDIVPALKILWKDYLQPIADFYWDYILDTWSNIKELFSGLGKSFDLFSKGDWWGGITTFFESIGSFVLEQIDNISTLLWNTIATIFGFETTDSVGGSIKQFFSDLWLTLKFEVMWMWEELKKTITETWDSIKTTITELWTSIKTTITELWPKIKNKVTEVFDDLWFAVHGVLGDFSFFKFLEETFGDLFTTIKALFGGDFSFENFKKLFGSLFDLAFYGINLAVNVVKDIFKWGDPEKPFKLSEFLFGDPEGVVTKVISWFKTLLGFGEEDKKLKEPFSLKTFLLDKIKDGIKWIGTLFGFDEEESKSLLDFSLTDFLFGKTGVITKVIDSIKGMFEGVSKFFKDLFGMGEGDNAGIDMSKLFGGISFEMPNFGDITDNIMSSVGEKINNALQWMAQKVANLFPFPGRDSLAELFADLGVTAAEMFDAKNISKFNVDSGKMDVIKTEPTRPPGSALGSGMGGGPGGGQGAVNANVVAPQTSNSSVEQKFSTPPSPQNPAAARNASLASGGLWG